ncbi:hypothetical protein HYPDE_41023 [Hyphomicrobium denitrificans 1NES1]|uniref:Uncharacterized protein n=1 Tax=Hyphomicrobium denitrificans 1NES1 TaxID=670307 RepID=N0BA34_9HYPH|nr:hypothetical protein [Hyphomicrobium denitrificans]AGK59873.1 hypothetical protein HYPDE_41023 [Hyphomicrobium denitrificans 1NES1]
MDRLDEIIIDQLSARILQPERLGDLLKTYLKSANNRSAESKERLSRLRQSHKEAEAAITRLLTLVEQGLMEAEDASLKERLIERFGAMSSPPRLPICRSVWRVANRPSRQRKSRSWPSC